MSHGENYNDLVHPGVAGIINPTIIAKLMKFVGSSAVLPFTHLIWTKSGVMCEA